MGQTHKIDGDKLRELRDKAWMDQAELAAAAGLARSTINQIENGHGNPRNKTILAIARVLKVNPNKLLKTPKGNDPLPQDARPGFDGELKPSEMYQTISRLV